MHRHCEQRVREEALEEARESLISAPGRDRGRPAAPSGTRDVLLVTIYYIIHRMGGRWGVVREVAA